MFVGVLRLTLHLPEPGSLKSKRHLIRSAIDRVLGKPFRMAELLRVVAELTGVGETGSP